MVVQSMWRPFSASRIPSNALLQIDKEKPQESIATLLQKFGRRTVANLYELYPAVILYIRYYYNV